MEFIHTLGPMGTDSHNAALWWGKRNSISVVLHEEFMNIYRHIDKHRGEYLIIPAGYRNKENVGWVDLHFKFLEVNEVVDVFCISTQPMCLVENIDYNINGSIIHPATEVFLNSIPRLGKNNDVYYANSKVRAFDQFIIHKYRYCITSECNLTKINKVDQIKALKKFNPKMVWCVYKIGGM
ncbi:hypothetical protein HB852_07190 [Listeria grandensis]|uniref:hypothetical protein n=1 Tax=Listeria grandensis TaxID=1494963 RepID=UPI001626F6B3|nr:hypothetical protein [Listeria grandensis]MBC1474399.1 hypothetical protein [Listeria grandensis]